MQEDQGQLAPGQTDGLTAPGVRIARVSHSPMVRPSRSAAIAALCSSGGMPFTVQGLTWSVVSKALSVSLPSVLLLAPKVRPDTRPSPTFARKSQTRDPLRSDFPGRQSDR